MAPNSYPLFSLQWISTKKGAFLLDVAMVFFKTTEHCLEVSQVILTFDLIHSPPHSLFLIMFVISVIFSASSSFTLLFSCKIIPPSVFFTRRAVSLAPGLWLQHSLIRRAIIFKYYKNENKFLIAIHVILVLHEPV